MSGKDSDKSAVRKIFTVLTSPIWVPVAATAGLVTAPFKAIGDSVKEGDEKNSAARGIGSLPGNVVGNVITTPFSAVKYAGDAMWKD